MYALESVLEDQGRVTTKESAMAKLYASEVSVRVANLAVQIRQEGA